MTGVRQVCARVGDFDLPQWRALAAIGEPLLGQPSRDYGHTFRLAVANNRAELLRYAQQRLDHTVDQAVARHHCQQPRPAVLPISAALLAMVMADLIDAVMFGRLVAPLTTAANLAQAGCGTAGTTIEGTCPTPGAAWRAERATKRCRKSAIYR
jgi:hypothetical protein